MSGKSGASAPVGGDQGTSNGNGSGNGDYLSVEQLLVNAPADITERDVEDVFGGKVRIRALTAAQAAKVQQAGIKTTQNRGIQVSIPEAEVTKFELAVIAPKMDHNQVLQAYQNSGPSFNKVLEAIDELSGTNDEELVKAQAAFPGPASS
jgi:hypothetical protein